MKNKTAKKILSIFILSAFLMQVLMPSMVLADNQPLNYDNPNNSGDNPYRLSLKGVITSGLLTNLVGCTGIVDKVAKVTVEFAQKLLGNKTEKAKVNSETKSKESSAVASVDSTAVEEDLEHSQEEESRDSSESFTENCLKGIAITLAKNQLTAMKKSTMNWVTTGFNGDPLYVRNVDSYMNSLTTRILKEETEFFGKVDNAKYYPYGRDYARGQVTSYKATQDTYASLKQDLTAYLEAGSTPESFANNFSECGWNGWLALTQHSQNNPLGFTLKANENLQNKQSNAVANAQAELARSGGIFDQKKCIEYEKVKFSATTCNGGVPIEQIPPDKTCVPDKPKTVSAPKCLKYETVTPGSVIKGKIDTYINSPERQIELADTLNDALNALFSSLINKFESQGLSGLGSKVNNWTTPASGGFGSNSLVDSLGNTLSSTGVFDATNSKTKVNESFDLTKDLGNKYVEATNGGSWDANTNTPELDPDASIKNQYYTVSVAGSTKLFAGTYNWKI
ncbi:MAG: hypothetical protein AAB895_03425, partial [Patescibacteria group bacterium]